MLWLRQYCGFANIVASPLLWLRQYCGSIFPNFTYTYGFHTNLFVGLVSLIWPIVFNSFFSLTLRSIKLSNFSCLVMILPASYQELLLA